MAVKTSRLVFEGCLTFKQADALINCTSKIVLKQGKHSNRMLNTRLPTVHASYWTSLNKPGGGGVPIQWGPIWTSLNMSGGGQSWGLYRNREGHPLPEQTDRLDWKHYPPPTYLAGSKYANKTRMTSQCSNSIGQVLLYLSDFQDVSLELFKWMKTWQETMNDPSPENRSMVAKH